MNAPIAATPAVHGLGAFLASRDMVEPPRRVARKLLDMGATWAPILVESLDGRRQRIDRITAIAAELRASDVRPLLYTFPHPARAEAAAEHVLEVCHLTGIQHPCLDIEPAPGVDWTERGIADLVATVRGAGHRPSITLFTRRQWDRMAWDQIAPDAPILLQVYERARDVDELDAAMARWPGRTVVPLVGTYVGDIERLRGDLARVRAHARDADAAGMWALATSDARERAALRGWAIETWRAAA